MAVPNKAKRLRFGPFELRVSTGELLKEGAMLKLQPQPFRVLLLLVSCPGQLISREEIQETLWTDGTTVEFDKGLNYCISQIRAVLNDDARDPKFIETLPKRGYRFIATVDSALSDQTGTPQAETTSQIADPRPLPNQRWWLATAAAAAIFLLAVVGTILGRGSATKLGIGPSVSRVTTYPGDETDPSLSPDGNQVAFSWDGGKAGGRYIYVVQIGVQNPLQITHHDSAESAADGFPAWSPDGSHIVFLRRHDLTHAEIVIIPSLGGPERKVQTIGALHRGPYPLFAWTPDSKQILFTAQTTEESVYHYTFNLLSVDTGQARLFRLAGSGAPGDASPAFSPDGQWLIFTRYSEIAKATLMAQKLGAGMVPQGEPMAVPGAGGDVPASPSWSPDSKRVIFSAGGKILEWVMGEKSRVVDATGPSVTLSTVWQRDGHIRSVTSRRISDADIWRLAMDPVTYKPSGSPVRIAASTANEGMPRFSPDGRRLAFTSDRSNAKEVWIADSNGENPKQLSHLNAYIAGFPRWSSDSKRIAFHARIPDQGEAWIYTADVDGGEPKRLAPGMTASWSLDPRYLYGGAPTGGKIIRVRITDGHVEQLFDGDMPVETTDGKRLLYAKTDGSCIYSRSLEGDPSKNTEECVVDDYTSPPGAGFVPVHNGFFYVGYTSEGKPRALKFYDAAQRRAEEIAPFQGSQLAVSLDLRQLLYVASEAKSGFDLALIEFR